LRLKNKLSKPLIKIKGIPVFVYALKTISQHPALKEIIVVANQANIQAIKSYLAQYRINKISAVVLGGRTRRISVERGLKALDKRVDFVLIHDAVRPFIQGKIISRVIAQARRFGAAVAGVPVKATIKRVKSNLIVERTLKRDELWEIQTPQVFRKDLILAAYKKFKDKDVTDDAALVEKLGKKVHLVLDSYNNIKITTPEDLVIAETICKKLKCHIG